jgi:hypothetical protein
MATHSLDDILIALDRHQQRATYSAVAALVDRTPRLLMRGRDRAPSNSWIVSKETGRPTGYRDDDIHPSLLANEKVLVTREELAAWLASVM